MSNITLRQTHPQKYWLKMVCKCIYYLGLGEFWYEARHSRFQRFYPIWAIISNFYIIILIVDELFSYIRQDLTMKEKHDLLQLSIGHPIICAKIVVMYLTFLSIKIVLERLLEDNRSIFPSAKLDNDSIKTAMKYCLAIACAVYLTSFATIMDGVMTHIKEDIPIRTEVTYFPGKHHSGFFVNLLRFIIEFHWWYIVSIMILIDCLSILSLTFSGSKFRRVRLYFKSLRNRFLENPHRKLNAAEEKQFWQDFVDGIKLHDDALWCAENVQHALGDIYSVQIVESIGLIIVCLIKLVTIERHLTPILANLGFILGLVVVTGSYMMDAAEITYEASLVSTAIFHCGWEFVSPRAGLRTLVVMAIQRSQVPVLMTAFGIITLSYSNFIMVLRSSYSFFAVMF
ncbi:uncharacterized protein [Epargyreus clarus]|uniref:uncharacterized protein n=1 Tax=Epargyreus clarus TaxID=520877 RepID=UPI003C3025D9